MMPLSRLGCPLSLKTAHMGNPGYNAFTGNNQGKLSHVFTGPKETSLDLIVEDLGSHYEMINVTFKPYPTPGYNNPVVDLMASLKRQHSIDPDLVERITVEVNWLEINYPSPAFPRPELKERRVGTIYIYGLLRMCGGRLSHARSLV